ncbi:MAG: adenine-specific methyltransferase EcoRI family protein [Treponema sp.]|jgi:hypothetical protein|nr:adenine-specific methyltransferase EcoRI family protein [Treponema sp.]
MGNETLNNAGKAKNDEFYTQISDIAHECSRYKEHFKGKTIFCNCDGPYESEFFKYFAMSFNYLGTEKNCLQAAILVPLLLPLFIILHTPPCPTENPAQSL